MIHTKQGILHCASVYKSRHSLPTWLSIMHLASRFNIDRRRLRRRRLLYVLQLVLSCLSFTLTTSGEVGTYAWLGHQDPWTAPPTKRNPMLSRLSQWRSLAKFYSGWALKTSFLCKEYSLSFLDSHTSFLTIHRFLSSFVL